MSEDTAPRTGAAPLLPVLALSFGAVLWGLWWLPLRIFHERGLPGDWAGALTYLAAALAILPFMLWDWRQVRTRLGALALMTLLAGASSAAFNHAVVHGEIVRVTLLFFLTPVWGTLFGAIVLRDPLDASRGLSIVLGLAGAGVVLGYEDGVPLPHSRADFAGLLSGILWGASLTAFRHRHAMPARDKAFANFLGAAILGAVVAASAPSLDPLDAERLMDLWPYVAAVGALWLVPKVIIELWGASRLDPGRAGVILLLEVIVAAGSATLLAGEQFGTREALGCVLVLGAGLIEVRAEMRKARPVPG